MIFNFGYPDILKIKSVLNSNKFKSSIGKDVTRCNINVSGVFFFNKKNKGKKDSKNIII